MSNPLDDSCARTVVQKRLLWSVVTKVSREGTQGATDRNSRARLQRGLALIL